MCSEEVEDFGHFFEIYACIYVCNRGEEEDEKFDG